MYPESFVQDFGHIIKYQTFFIMMFIVRKQEMSGKEKSFVLDRYSLNS